MGEETDDKRLLAVMKELYRCELELSVTSSAIIEQELNELYKYRSLRPQRYARLRKNAARVLFALDSLSKPAPLSKPSLTGEELWKTIVDTSKP